MNLNALEHLPRLVERSKALLALVQELEDGKQMSFWRVDIQAHWDQTRSELKATIHDMEGDGDESQ